MMTEVYEAIEAKWNLVAECIPEEEGIYVVTTADKKIGILAYVGGIWYSARHNDAVVYQGSLEKWYSISIPDPDEGE